MNITTIAPDSRQSLIVVAFLASVFLFNSHIVGSAWSQSSSGDSSSSAGSGNLSDEVLSNSLIRDYNGDGVIEIDAFGDSITKGSGDLVPVGEENAEFPQTNNKFGYPYRVETYLGILVDNEGVPGEVISRAGLQRFTSSLKQATPDIVLIEGGANDANEGVSGSEYTAALQTMINLAHLSGVKVVLHTTPPTCCDHSNITNLVEGFVNVMRSLAAINGLTVADSHQAFKNSCTSGEECYLLNLPEGLHPNIAGYDIMGEVATATLLKIDLLADGGAAELEKALNLAPGSIKTKPTPSTTP